VRRVDEGQRGGSAGPHESVQGTGGAQGERVGHRIARPVQDAAPEIGAPVETLRQEFAQVGGEG
jgi:hypothetical protein